MLVCIDPGHGGSDSGAMAFGVKEKDVNLRIAKKLNAALYSKGVDAVLTRDSDIAVTLGKRVQLSRGANVFVSLHCNADADDDVDAGREANGFEVLVHKAPSILGERIVKELSRIQLPSRGVRERPGLYVLRETTIPAVLVEMGFIDSRQDHRLLVDDWHQWLIAMALAEALSK